mmetsp:Transcript_5437/g.18994  ORF Transcript_5437/g.18994 Transcript_5437/m.18994 type:complete len:265 (-) Transcript_5437:286-1080(-)
MLLGRMVGILYSSGFFRAAYTASSRETSFCHFRNLGSHTEGGRSSSAGRGFFLGLPGPRFLAGGTSRPPVATESRFLGLPGPLFFGVVSAKFAASGSMLSSAVKSPPPPPPSPPPSPSVAGAGFGCFLGLPGPLFFGGVASGFGSFLGLPLPRVSTTSASTSLGATFAAVSRGLGLILSVSARSIPSLLRSRNRASASRVPTSRPFSSPLAPPASTRANSCLYMSSDHSCAKMEARSLATSSSPRRATGTPLASSSPSGSPRAT